MTNLLRLLELPDEVQRPHRGGSSAKVTAARCSGSPITASAGGGAAVSEGFTVRQVEALVRSGTKRGRKWPRLRRGRPPAPSHADLVDELYGVLEARLAIRTGKRGGSIQIAFKNPTSCSGSWACCAPWP